MIELSSELQERKSMESILLSQAALVKAMDAIQQELIKPGKKYVYGIQGLEDLFHCSRSTAHRIKATGLIDDAICQIGHTIIIDAEMAIELLKGRRSYNRRS